MRLSLHADFSSNKFTKGAEKLRWHAIIQAFARSAIGRVGVKVEAMVAKGDANLALGLVEGGFKMMRSTRTRVFPSQLEGVEQLLDFRGIGNGKVDGCNVGQSERVIGAPKRSIPFGVVGISVRDYDVRGPQEKAGSCATRPLGQPEAKEEQPHDHGEDGIFHSHAKRTPAGLAVSSIPRRPRSCQVVD